MKRFVAIALVFGFVLVGCPEMSDNPQVKNYIVTFDADNGSNNTMQTVNEGGTVNESTPPTKANDMAGLYAGTPPTNYTFDGWYKGETKWNFTSDTVSEDITLTAKWIAPSTIDLASVSGNNVVEKTVSYVNANSGSEYTLVLETDVPNVEPQTLDQNNTALTITSNSNTERKIILGNTNGSLFTVGGIYLGDGNWEPRSAKLIIDGYITLQGRKDNSGALVNIRYGGNSDLKGFTKIIGNYGSPYGGGIYANGSSGTGAGVSITMSGNAEISGNTNLVTAGLGGAGVIITGGNTIFTMSDNAIIKNNSTDDDGGGVGLGFGATFIMNGGEITDNSAANGGGVSIVPFGTFVVANEQILLGIHDNTASDGAQNVSKFAANGIFTVGGIDWDNF